MSAAASSLSGLPPCEVLRDILARKRVVLPDGEEKPLTANVSPRIAEVLYATVKRIDVGLAPDFSGRTVLHSVARRILNRPRQDRFFRKKLV